MKTIDKNPADPNFKYVDKPYSSDPGNSSYNSDQVDEKVKADFFTEKDSNIGLNDEADSMDEAFDIY